MDVEIGNALNRLVSDDLIILQHDASERSICHKIGAYLQDEFPELNVDVEYNRNFDGSTKSLEIDFESIRTALLEAARWFIMSNEEHNTKYRTNEMNKHEREIHILKIIKREIRDSEFIDDPTLGALIKITNGSDTKTRRVFPDIIVHNRRNADQNEIVVEVKKSSNKDYKDRAFDLIKLRAFMQSERYSYKKAYFVDIPTGGDAEHEIIMKQRSSTFDREIQVIKAYEI